MAIQDRNAHKDAVFIRKPVAVAIPVPGTADIDEPVWVHQPRYNYRITDLSLYASVVATAAEDLRLLAGQRLSALGRVDAVGNAAITFSLPALWQVRADGSLILRAADATVDFSEAFTITANLWGTVTVMIDDAGVYTTRAARQLQAFATRAEAEAAAAPVGSGQGLVCVLTLQAGGGDFIGLTTNTNAANALFSPSRIGHVGTLAIDTGPQYVQGTRETALLVAGVPTVSGAANVDPIVLLARSTGTPVLTEAQATGEWRKIPAQGESTGGATGLSSPFVP